MTFSVIFGMIFGLLGMPGCTLGTATHPTLKVPQAVVVCEVNVTPQTPTVVPSRGRR